uniref:Putative myosin heavy chain n=1 Tax=Toxoplasma gondii TgCATBr9 TaxID=943120 RepID=A0A2T6ISG6_TOXGO|nr:putative myosin heavy chain [Toxoplasma gondii TgCATBr9]
MRNRRRGLLIFGIVTAMLWLFIDVTTTESAGVQPLTAETASPGGIPESRPLRYPFPATASKLNRNATYRVRGKTCAYTYRSNDGSFNFTPVPEGGLLNVASLENVEVLNDPLAQAIEDANVVGELVERAKNRRSDVGGDVDEFVLRAETLATELKQALVTRDLARVEQTEEAFRKDFDALREVHSSIQNVQGEMQTALDRGKELLVHLEGIAKNLRDNALLNKVLRMYSTQLQNEMAASVRERASTEAFIAQSNETMKRLQKEYREGMENLEKHKQILQQVDDVGKQLLGIGSVRKVMHAALKTAQEIKTQSAAAEQDADRGLVRVEALSYACNRSETEIRNEMSKLLKVETELLKAVEEMEHRLKGGPRSKTSEAARLALEEMRNRIQRSAHSVEDLGQECYKALDEARVHLENCKKKNTERIQAKISGTQALIQRTREWLGQSQKDNLRDVQLKLEEHTRLLKALTQTIDNNFEDFSRVSSATAAAQSVAAALAEFEKNFNASAAKLQEEHQLVLRELEELVNGSDTPQIRLQIGVVATELRQSSEGLKHFAEQVSSSGLKEDFRQSVLALLRRQLLAAVDNIADAKRLEAHVMDLIKKSSDDVAAFRRTMAAAETEVEQLATKNKQKGSRSGPDAFPNDPKVCNNLRVLRRKQIEALRQLATSAEAVKVNSNTDVTEMEKKIDLARRVSTSVRDILANQALLAAVDDIDIPEQQGKHTEQLRGEAERLEKEVKQLETQLQKTKDAVRGRENLLEIEVANLGDAGNEVISEFVELLKKAAEEALKEGPKLETLLAHLERLANNFKAKREGNAPNPPPIDGSFTEEEAVAEAAMDADEIFRAASDKNDELQKKLKDYQEQIDSLLNDVGLTKGLLEALVPQTRTTGERQSSGRRLSSSAILTGQQIGTYRQELAVIEEALTNEKQKIKDMGMRGQKAIEDVATKAAEQVPPASQRSTHEATNGTWWSHGLLLGVALGICIPFVIAIIALIRCYYGRKKKRETGASNALSEEHATRVASEASDTPGRGTSANVDHLQGRKGYSPEFGDLEKAFSGVEHPVIAGIVPRETLETPPAGTPDTSHMQYMVDEHYTVARNLYRGAEHELSFEGFPTAVVRKQRTQPRE